MRQDLSVNLLTCIHSWILQYSSGGHHTFEYDIYKFHQHLIIISILSLLDVSVKSTCSVTSDSDKHLFCHVCQWQAPVLSYQIPHEKTCYYTPTAYTVNASYHTGSVAVCILAFSQLLHRSIKAIMVFCQLITFELLNFEFEYNQHLNNTRSYWTILIIHAAVEPY